MMGQIGSHVKRAMMMRRLRGPSFVLRCPRLVFNPSGGAAMTSPRSFASASLVAALGAALGLALFPPGGADANGGKAKMLRLEDRVAIEGGRSCDFLCEIDPTLFPLLGLKDRYKVLRI